VTGWNEKDMKISRLFLDYMHHWILENENNSTYLCVESTAKYFISLREANQKEDTAIVKF